jgi:K+-transporting ATPase ATPase C chain
MQNLYALLRHGLLGLRLLLMLTLLLGLLYPLAIAAVAAATMPWQAHGSLVDAAGKPVTDSGDAVGSALLGQRVDGSALFQPRPSAAGEGYDPLQTSGSNLGPESPDLIARVNERRQDIAEREGVDLGAVPPDALTASGSGLDPHISPAYAALQVARVARATGLTVQEVRELVTEHTSGRTLGVLGEPRVNVLTLNIDVLRRAALNTND